MADFLTEVSKPLFIFLVGALIGVVKAWLRKSPISKKEEFLNYHRYLKKPVIWTFITMFLIFLLIGLGVNPDKTEVFQRALIYGLYASAAIYIFMIWGANLIKGKK